jgi:AcrR family transcriptional regulator
MKLRTDTRDRLIDAARDLFYRQGYAATGVAQILKEAGVNSGSLYYFFPTKEDLLLAVLEWYKANLWPEVIQPVFDRITDPIERIFGVLDGYRQMLIMTGCTGGCPVGNISIELADTHPNVRALVAENFTNWAAAVRGCVEDAAGRLPDDVNPRQLSHFILTVMEGAIMQARAFRSLEPFESAVAQLRDYFDRLHAAGTNWTSQQGDAGVGRHRMNGDDDPTLN